MANNIIRVGDVEIMALSDGMLEFDLCNFFPTIPHDDWRPYESHLTEAHKVRFNLGSYLIRSDGRTVLVDTGLGPKDRKSTRLNSSHVAISYAVFCLKKKSITLTQQVM